MHTVFILHDSNSYRKQTITIKAKETESTEGLNSNTNYIYFHLFIQPPCSTHFISKQSTQVPRRYSDILLKSSLLRQSVKKISISGSPATGHRQLILKKEETLCRELLLANDYFENRLICRLFF